MQVFPEHDRTGPGSREQPPAPEAPEPTRAPAVAFTVEVAEGRLHLRIEVGPKSIPIPISPDQAGALGAALIGACALYAEDRVPEPGPILRSDLPVVGWRTGVIREHGLAVLLVDILGGPEIALQFQPSVAVSCGRSLLETGKTLQSALA